METNSIADLLKPQHQNILENQEHYTFQEINQARKNAQIEQKQAAASGMTIEQFREQNHAVRKQIQQKTDAHTELLCERKNATIEIFGLKVKELLQHECLSAGGELRVDDAKTKEVYNEIIRYFHWNTNCTKLDKRKFLYLFGPYGCGKSTLVKSCYSAINYFYGTESNWTYFHLPTLINKCLEEKSIKPFSVLFECRKNMIIDEIGDQVEKQRIYGDEIQSIRMLVLDKYDKWISNSWNPEAHKIVFTSNLFPDNSYFYTQKHNDNRPTLRNFYDEKFYNKMLEMCNLVRFPNVSHRLNNTVELI